MSQSRHHAAWKYSFWTLFAVLCLVGSWHGLKYFIDYEMYVRAAHKVISGEVADLHELARMESPKFHYSYFYGLLFAPFALMGGAGRYAYLAFFCLAYAYLIFSSSRWAALALDKEKDETFRYAILVGVVLLTLIAINDAFMTANIAILLAAGCQLAFALRERFPVAAGAVMGMVITIKLYPGLLLGFFLWERRFKLVAATLLSVVACYLAIPALFVGPKMAWYLIGTQSDVLARFAAHWSYEALAFQNLAGALVRASEWARTNQNDAVRLTLILGCSALAAFYWKSFVRDRATKVPLDLTVRLYALAMGAVPLVLPVSWYNVGVFYAPLIAYSCGLLRQGRRGPAAWGLLAYVALYGLTSSDLWGRHLNDRMEFYSIPFYGALAMVIGFAWDTARAHPDFFPHFPFTKVRPTFVRASQK